MSAPAMSLRSTSRPRSSFRLSTTLRLFGFTQKCTDPSLPTALSQWRTMSPPCAAPWQVVHRGHPHHTCNVACDDCPSSAIWPLLPPCARCPVHCSSAILLLFSVSHSSRLYALCCLHSALWEAPPRGQPTLSISETPSRGEGRRVLA